MFASAGRSSFLLLDRRKFLAGAAGFIAAGLLPREVLALAGPHNFKHGDFDITVVSDGELILPWNVIAPDAPPEELKKLLGAAIAGDTVSAAVSPVVIKAGSDVILFDTGSGPNSQATVGKLTETLAMAGITPGAITKVVFTHAHPDHISGTARDGGLTFPNASHHVAEAEWNFWSDKDLPGKMPEGMRPMVLGVQQQLAAATDRLVMFKPGEDIVTGVAALDMAGHTPGHVAFEIKGGEGLILAGDTIISPFASFPHPEWRTGFDANPELAIASRKKLLDRAAADKIRLLGFHWPYPGMGYAEKKDGAYQFVAAS